MAIPATARILIIGGTGFVGAHLTEALVERGHTVTLTTRHRESVREKLILLPGVTVIESNAHDRNALAALMPGYDVLINLVGILHGSAADYDRAHVQLTELLLETAQLTGIQRYLHMSALGASLDAPSNYQKSKARAEAKVRASALAYTIYRPSLIFGEGKCILSMFADLLKLAPVLPLAGAGSLVQPIWVGDVVRAFMAGLSRDDLLGQSLNLVGPKVYTLQQLAEYIGQTAGTPRPILPLPDPIARLQAAMLGLLPKPPLTVDNLDALTIPNVDANGFPTLLGWQPSALEAIAPSVLANRRPRGRYLDYRKRAGR